MADNSSESDHSDIDLDLDYSSGSSEGDEVVVDVHRGEISEDSDDEDDQDEDVDHAQNGVQFGMYEPVVHDLVDREIPLPVPEVVIDENRLLNEDWCQCGHCRRMPSFKPFECICCQEIPQVAEEAERLGSRCIITTEAFEPSILHPISLYIGWLEYTDRWRQAAKSFDRRNNERYRYVAYRKLVRWCWGWLGKNIRVTLPACAHARIMEEYPSETGTYRGTILLRPLVVD